MSDFVTKVVQLNSDVAKSLPRHIWDLTVIGPCANCGETHQRYGKEGTPLCKECTTDHRTSGGTQPNERENEDD
jgi:hypothetical protein